MARRRHPSASLPKHLLLLAAATALGLVVSRPALADAPPRAPVLALEYGGGLGASQLAGQGLARYTGWLSPTFGFGPEVFIGVGLSQTGPVVTAGGADLALAWRRPGRVADLVLRGGLGGAFYTYSPTPCCAPAHGPSQEVDTGAFDAAAEASLVFHPWTSVGLLAGARSYLLVPGRGLKPWWSVELMLGIAWTR